jgi:hydroxyacylglutathione hydrolase
MSVHEVKRAGKKLQLLDVRSPDEWKTGHMPSAHHVFLPQLREKAAELNHEKPTAVYCDSGYRASIAASILKQEGFADVRSVPGSWQAWKKAGFPVEGKIAKK